jgi:hypothetical protein
MVVVAMDEGEAHGYGHGWLGKMILGFGDVVTMPWGCFKSSSLARSSTEGDRASGVLYA